MSVSFIISIRNLVCYMSMGGFPVMKITLQYMIGVAHQFAEFRPYAMKRVNTLAVP